MITGVNVEMLELFQVPCGELGRELLALSGLH